MSTKTIYQTLEDRATNLDNLVKSGPYSCNWQNSWLGDGYYFWDSFIKNAHWWGAEVRRYAKGYIICRAICDYSDETCCDLVGSTNHLQMMYDSYELLKAKGLANSRTKVKRLIEYLQREVGTFKFEAVRAYGIRSKTYESRFSFNLNFEDNRPAYMDLLPAIQICFYAKTSLNLRNYKIVFPDEYIDGYVV